VSVSDYKIERGDVYIDRCDESRQVTVALVWRYGNGRRVVFRRPDGSERIALGLTGFLRAYRPASEVAA
jgi:hypothetical protein